MTPTHLIAIGLVLASVGLAGMLRAMAPTHAAESAWVRSVAHQLAEDGSYDDGLLRVVAYPDGWHLALCGGGYYVPLAWAGSRTALLRHLREHYRAARADAARGVRGVA